MSMTLRNRKFTPEPASEAPKKMERVSKYALAYKAIQLVIASSVILLCALVMLVLFNNNTGWQLSRHGTNFLDKLSVALGLQEHIYTVVIDAGSTGSRVLAFSFHRSLSDQSVKLDDEFYDFIQPGLSSFSDDPKKGADSIKGLLNNAKKFVPMQYWHSTPLVLKATAGLRLLPTEKADLILKEVRSVFEESGFLITGNSVTIMDGVDEGLFSWFTINFLLDRLNDPHSTVAALDLGGGSTQITFAPKDTATVEVAPQGFIHQVSALHHNIPIYSYSYLGLGLKAARKQILSVANPDGSLTLKSPCINPLVKKGWVYNGITYTVTGTHEVDVESIPMDQWQLKKGIPAADFKQCLEITKELVHNSVHKPTELNSREVMAISYYYDRASEHGLIDATEGGTISITQLFESAKYICLVPNPDQAFACMDMTYIAALLHHGFGLSLDTVLHMKKKIDGHETSWALGAAFHVLHNGI